MNHTPDYMASHRAGLSMLRGAPIAGGDIAAEDRLRVYSAMTTMELRSKLLCYNLFDKSWEAPWVAGAETVYIPKPDFVADEAANPDEGVVIRDRARGGDWGAVSVPDASRVAFTRSGEKQTSQETIVEDALELNWNVVDRMRSRGVFDIRSQIDRAMFTSIIGYPSTNTVLGANGTAFISRASPYAETKPAADQYLMITAIEMWSLAAYRKDFIDGEGAQVRPFMIVHPELSMSLRRALLALGLSLDTLTDNVLSSNVGVSRPGLAYLGTLFDVDIYSWNALAVPLGAADWVIYCGIQQAAAVGIRRPSATQYWTPDQNQVSTKPAYLFRQSVPYGVAEVEDSWHQLITIKAD